MMTPQQGCAGSARGVSLSRPGKHKKGGWTLIELLVVAVALAVFVSLVTGALTQARADGRLMICLSNLNQIGQAMNQYFAEFDDQFPWLSHVEYADCCRSNQTWYYGGRYPPINVGANVAANLRFLPEERPFNAYLYPGVTGREADLPIYRCPCEDGTRWLAAGSPDFVHDPRLAYLTTGTSYRANWWWIIYSSISTEAYGAASWLGYMPDYGRKLVRYKLDVQGAEQFVALHGDPLDTMIFLEGPYPGWHGELGFSEVLFLDGHAAYQFTDTRRMARYRNVEWTLWFSERTNEVPDMFIPPFPGIEEYECPEP